MSKAWTYKQLLTIAAAGAIVGISSPSYAASFAIKEQNVRHLGTAYAGSASEAADASIAAYNPAGLTALQDDFHFVAGGVSITGSQELNVTNATNQHAGGAPANAVTAGKTKPNGSAFVPNFHIAKRFDDQLVASFNVMAPFGLKTKYSGTSPARFAATRSELRTVSVGPSLAYKVNDQFSIGAAVDAFYAKAWLDTQANFGGGEGFQKQSANDWTYGFRLGVMYHLSESTRMGLSYRHKYKVKAKGTSLTSIPLVNVSLGGAIPDSRTIKANITLPETVVYSIFHQLDDQWSMMGEIEYMRWNRFKELRLDYEGRPITDTRIIPQNYKNVFRFSVGANYVVDDNWQVRAGYAYDKSPTNDRDRTARIPDSSRHWFSVGGTYTVSRALSFDAGYTYLKFKNANLNESAPLNGNRATTAAAQNLTATLKSHAHLLGVQMKWNFV